MQDTTDGFRVVPRTGVIYVMTEARNKGYKFGDPNWSNLGQGAPGVEALEGAPPRVKSITVGQVEYSPVDGLPELKKAVADLYNQRYGRKYTGENVSISSGGRLALTRVVSTLGRVNVGHFLPDYTAYEELLDAFGTFVPIPILLDPEKAYQFSANDLEREILGRGLSAVVVSNPGNPTGRLISGDLLRDWVEVARSTGCYLKIFSWPFALTS